MKMLTSPGVILFAVRLDRRGLSREDERGDFGPVSAGARALDVLQLLVERPGDIVSRDDIMAAVWPGAAVEDGNLTVQISTLRRVLGPGSERRAAASRMWPGAATALPRR
jgi:DNA-binding winged helix-turn-helix (wHTH) protein